MSADIGMVILIGVVSLVILPISCACLVSAIFAGDNFLLSLSLVALVISSTTVFATCRIEGTMRKNASSTEETVATKEAEGE